MYTSHLKIKPVNTGKGVFANIQIPANIPILEFGGDLNATQDVSQDVSQDVLQIGPNFYLNPSGNIGDKVRHSCNPNCYLHIIGKRAMLYSAYLIQPESELTFDYATSSTDNLDKWKMDCKCGAYNCRKVISGLHYVSPAVQEEYKTKGLVPLFMTHSIFMKK